MIRRLFERARTREEVFRAIYKQNRWGDGESVSGPGSRLDRTSAFSHELPVLFAALEIRSLLDAPCGDCNWITRVGLSLDHYTGVDIVPELIAWNQTAHAGSARTFLQRDLVVDPLPQADLILCRDGLVHLSHGDALAALGNFKRSGSRYLLTTTFVAVERNREIRTGGWRPLNLERPPFSLPPPLQTIDERRFLPNGRWSGKTLGLWALASVPG